MVRDYCDGDAAATLRVFRRAVEVTAAADYSEVQVDAWKAVDPVAWGPDRLARSTLVAEAGGEVVGFTDADANGYIDMLYVDPERLRRGIATELLRAASDCAVRRGAAHLRTHASLTARPFFERHGFVVRRVQRPVVRGVVFINFEMTRPTQGL